MSEEEVIPTQARPSLVTNAISNWIALCVNLAIGFFLTPYIIKCLDVAQYGIWTLIVSVIGYYGLLDLGVRSAATRYVARYASQKDTKALNDTVNTALAMFCFVGMLVAVASLFVASYLAKFFHISSTDYESFKQVIWLLGFSAGVEFPSSVFAVIIIAHERFVLSNIIRIIFSLIRGGLIFLVLYSGGGLVSLGWVNVGLAVSGILAHLIIVRLNFNYIKFSPKLVQKTSLFSLTGFGLAAFIGKMGDLLRFKLDAAVIGRYLNMELVGVYGLATVLFGWLFNIIIACSGVTMPRLAAIAGKDDKKRFSEAVMRYSVIVSTVAVGLGMVVFLLSKDFLKLWAPENFRDVNSAATVFLILLVGLIPDFMTSVSINALQAVKKHKYYAYQTIIEGTSNLLLSILLVVRFGIFGVAIGTAVPSLITKLIVQPIYCCRIVKIRWWEYMLNVLIKPLLVFVCSIVFWFGVGVNFAVKTYPQLVLKGFVILIAYSIIAYLFCLDKESCQRIKVKFHMISRRLQA